MDVKESGSVRVEEREFLRQELRQSLHLEEPVGEDVLQSVIEDPLYAYHLRICRQTPALLRHLLANPPLKKSAVASDESNNKAVVELAASAIAALWNWRKAGFNKVEAHTFEKRWSACLACPHLVAPPAKFIYKLTNSQKKDSRICALCGCVASRKAQFPTESCPDRHPQNESVNRWGEVFHT